MTKHKRPVVEASALGFPLGFVIGISSFVWQIRHDACSDKNVHERDLKKEQPAEPHELVVAEPGQGPAHPHEHENDHGNFGEKGCNVEQAADYSAPARGGSIDKRPVKSAVP